MAVQYQFLANEGLEHHHPHSSTTTTTPFFIEPFDATHGQKDYEIPWSLRDIIADERVAYLFEREIVQLRDVFREWAPKTSVLKDVKRKLQQIQRSLETADLQGTTRKTEARMD